LANASGINRKCINFKYCMKAVQADCWSVASITSCQVTAVMASSGWYRPAIGLLSNTHWNAPLSYSRWTVTSTAQHVRIMQGLQRGPSNPHDGEMIGK
jgi:hypothetical protein